MEIDKSLYSRQLYTIGKDAMEALKDTSVLISGMTGLGVEIAKCVILSGVKSVTLHDTTKIKIKDLSSNYYAEINDVGRNRADVVKSRLAMLNPYVSVTSNSSALSESHFKRNQIVVVCDQFPFSQIYNNNLARLYGTKFIVANTVGLMGGIFCDFGKNFCTVDTDGETLKSGILIEASDSNTFISSEPHQLYVGDTVNIKFGKKSSGDVVEKIVNAITFKTKKHYKIKKNTLTNCSFEQFKQPVYMDFLPIVESLNEPEFSCVITSDFDRSRLLHDFTRALDTFVKKYGELPEEWNNDDAEVILELVKCENDEQKDVIKKLSYTCRGKLCPVDSIFGSIVAQEVIKASSKKYTPIKQWLYMDFVDIISNTPPALLSEDIPHIYDVDDGNESIIRYTSQVSIFGLEFQKILSDAKVFIVGAGAIGCELLKNLAMIGIGNITITDMDRIEKSNLNRQFLFGNSDIGKFKSECAKNAILKMNPDINVIAQKNKVGSESISVYNDKFLESQTCVLTALDNIQARLYVDKRCVETKSCLIDSGTLGTKGNVQVVIPHITESYGSSQDPPEKTIPMCTLKDFPYLIEHCIQWARDKFEGIFVKAPQNVLRYQKDPEQIKLLATSERIEIENDIMFVHENNVGHEKECISFAYKLWHEYYRDQIYNLITKFPEDNVTDEGIAFWTGTKKFPKVAKFENTDTNIEFLEATANLWASVFGLPNVTKKQIMHFLKKVKEPKLVSKKEEDEDRKFTINPSDIDYVVKPLSFEKDDDTNFHIDFVTSASNLRALNYSIDTVDKFKTKGIAGKIIPAIITTTSLVSGLACIELLKILNKTTKYTNSFTNLALPFIAFSEPNESKKCKVGQYEYSMWDSLTYSDMRIKDFLKEIKKVCGVDVMSISVGQYSLYSDLASDKVKTDRLKMTLNEAYIKVSNDNQNDCLMVSVFLDTEEDIEPITCKIKIIKRSKNDSISYK